MQNEIIITEYVYTTDGRIMVIAGSVPGVSSITIADKGQWFVLQLSAHTVVNGPKLLCAESYTPSSPEKWSWLGY